MGGNAFHAVLAPEAFPRLPPAVYHGLKTRFQPILESIYTYVAIPHEAPEKGDHGDLDFIVCFPKASYDSSDAGQPTMVNVPHQIIQDALGAEYANPMDGERTSNFAIPIQEGEWSCYGFGHEEIQRRAQVGNGKIYYQIDVNACALKETWEKRVFFHSYGDLNQITGAIARNVGLQINTQGLKLRDPGYPMFHLSDSYADIFEFFGWSMTRRNAGFATREDCFEWAASSKYFDPVAFGSQIHKRQADRTMYVEFVNWVSRRRLVDKEGRAVCVKSDQVREDALDFFGKRPDWEALQSERQRKELFKTLFSGSRIRDWAELGNYWTGVKRIMDAIRGQFGGNDEIARLLQEKGEQWLKEVVIQSRDRLQIQPSSAH